MMGQQKSEAQLFNYAVNLEKRVRSNHPLRKVKAAIDFGFVREAVAHCYGKNGNESVAPEVILKMMFLLFFDDIKSERELMEVIGQPRLREHPQDLPDASLQNHARPLGHGADVVHEIPRGRGRRLDVHNTSEVLFPLCANTDPQRDSIFTKGPADVLGHATSEIAIGTKLGIDATRKLTGEGDKRGWPPLIQMDENTRKKIDALPGEIRGNDIWRSTSTNSELGKLE